MSALSAGLLGPVLLVLGSWWAAAPLLAARPSRTVPARGRRRERRSGGARDRTALALALLGAALGVVLTRALVPWQSVPPVLWAVPVALAVAGVPAAARRWQELPAVASARPRWRLAAAGAEAVVSAALLAVIIGA